MARAVCQPVGRWPWWAAGLTWYSIGLLSRKEVNRAHATALMLSETAIGADAIQPLSRNTLRTLKQAVPRWINDASVTCLYAKEKNTCDICTEWYSVS